MTSLLLTFWLAAATGAGTGTNPAAPAAAPTVPQAPTVPAAPAVNGPPLPAPPEFPSSQRGSLPAPAGKPDKNGPEADETMAEAPAGKHESGKKKSAAAGSQGRGVPNLPALSPTALKNELRQSLSAPGGSKLLTDRARLEQLSAEIAQAREALRQETARLEELIRKRGSCDGELRAAAVAAAARPKGTDDAAAVAAAARPKGTADAAAANDAEREQLETVSKAMKGMKPEQAAAVVTRLDHRLASEVLRRMRPADAGAILGFLRPEYAAELATEIATRRPTIPLKKGGSTP